MTILVTGTSGHLGHLVVDALLDRGTPASDIVATARDTSRIADLAERGVRTAALDYADPASIAAALEGVDRVLLVSGSEPGSRLQLHKNVIDAAAAAGVAQLVYTSAPKADHTSLVLAPDHLATEQAIAAAGLPATIVRNSWYNENYLQQLDVARATGEIIGSAGEGRVASASRRDFAEGAAVVLTSDGHIGKTYEFAGDTAWTFDELASTLSEVLGKPVTYRNVTTDEHVAALQGAGLDAGTAGFVAALDANIVDGALDVQDDTLHRLIGRDTTPIADTFREALKA